MAVFNNIWLPFLTLKLLWISLCKFLFPSHYWWEGRLVLAVTVQTRVAGSSAGENPNIFFTFFYIVGREIRKKLVYEIQIWAQKLCILRCTHKISCHAFESVISARFSARKIFLRRLRQPGGVSWVDVNCWLILFLFHSFSSFSFLKYPVKWTENHFFSSSRRRTRVRCTRPRVVLYKSYLRTRG